MGLTLGMALRRKLEVIPWRHRLGLAPIGQIVGPCDLSRLADDRAPLDGVDAPHRPHKRRRKGSRCGRRDRPPHRQCWVTDRLAFLHSEISSTALSFGHSRSWCANRGECSVQLQPPAARIRVPVVDVGSNPGVLSEGAGQGAQAGGEGPVQSASWEKPSRLHLR